MSPATGPARVLVVGVDGSEVAGRALRWAAAATAAFGARLVAVHAVGLLEGAGYTASFDLAAALAEVPGLEGLDGSGGTGGSGGSGGSAGARGAGAAEGSEGSEGAGPGGSIEGLAVYEPGPPDQALLRVAEREAADLVVVGHRGAGETLEPLGSTAAAVVAATRVPVVVVP